MKKMMMFILAVVSAGLLQAASVDWQFTSSAECEGLTVYTLLSVPTEITSLQSITDLENSHGILAKRGRSVYATGKFSDEKIVGNSASYYFFITANIGGTDYYWTNKDAQGNFAAVTGSAYAPPATGSVNKFNASTLTGTPGVPGDGWVAVANIPEPTSMALLLLGVAAFGLRRRIRG